MRVLRTKCLPVAVCVLVSLLLVMVVPMALAAPVASKTTRNESMAARAQIVKQVSQALDRQVVKEQLKALGMGEKQVTERLAQISDQELRELAAGSEQLRQAGGVTTLSTTEIVLLLILVVLIVD